MRDAMACPGCGGQMVPGFLRVKGALADILFFGFGWQHLWWSDTAESRESRQRVIDAGSGRQADRCAACGMIAFKPF